MNPFPLTVALLDADAVFRSAFVNFLDADTRFAHCHSLEDIDIEKLQALKPDVIVSEIRFGACHRLQDVAALHGVCTLPILLCSDVEDIGAVTSAFRAGINGYVLKRDGFAKIAEATVEIYGGGAALSKALLCQMIVSLRSPEEPNNGLTQREHEIANLLRKGYRYKQIAEDLFISLPTVRSHIQNIYRKLDVTSRTAALNKLSNTTSRVGNSRSY